jgi:hypothetical protein
LQKIADQLRFDVAILKIDWGHSRRGIDEPGAGSVAYGFLRRAFALQSALDPLLNAALRLLGIIHDVLLACDLLSQPTDIVLNVRSLLGVGAAKITLGVRQTIL